MKNLLSLTFLIFLLCPNGSYASTCRHPGFEKAYKNATVIFTGEIIDGFGHPSDYKKMLFKVIDVYKGNPELEVYVSSGNSSNGTGSYLVKGEKYLVYASFNKTYLGQELSTHACAGTKHLSQVTDKDLSPLVDKRKAVEDLDDLIRSNPQKPELLIAKTELFLERNDFANAETVLKQIIDKNPEDNWAKEKLASALYEQDKAEELWRIYYDSIKEKNYSEDISRYLDYAALKLGKGLNERGYLILENVWLKDLKYSAQTLKIESAVNAQFNNLDLQDGKILGEDIKALRIYSSNLSGTNLSGAEGDISFNNTNLKGADFSNSQITTLGLGNSDVTDANFQNSIITKAYWVRQDLKNANFKNAQILNGRLQHANFSNSNLEGVSLKGSEYSCETSWPKGFDPIKAGATNKYNCNGNKKVDNKPENLEQTLKSNEYVGKDYSYRVFQDKQDFRGLNFTNANFSNSKMMKWGNFDYSNLSETNFRWARVGTSFNFAVIHKTDFSYANFSNGRDFIGSEIKDAVFEHAVLKGITFRDVTVLGGRFHGADLFRAKISQSYFPKADFTNTSLHQAYVYGSDFSGSDFSNADLEQIRFGKREGGGEWSPSKFVGANLENVVLNMADVRGVDFSRANFKNTTLLLTQYDCATKWPLDLKVGEKGAVLRDENCMPTNYSNPNLVKADLIGSHLIDLNLKDADLSGANLKRSTIRNSDFSSAKLDNVDFTAAVFDCETKWPNDFDPIKAGAYLKTGVHDLECNHRYGIANLAGKDLSGMDFRRTSLAKANLQKVNLKGANLYNTDLFKANLSGANLEGADMRRANLNNSILKGITYDCKTRWPYNFKAEEFGVKIDATCSKMKDFQDTGRRALVESGYIDDTTDENVLIESKNLHWFNGRGWLLKNITFKNVMMRKSKLWKVELENVKFLNSDLRDSDFQQATLNNVDFTGSDLRGVDFYGAKIGDVTWDNIVYDCKTVGLPLPKKLCLKE